MVQLCEKGRWQASDLGQLPASFAVFILSGEGNIRASEMAYQIKGLAHKPEDLSSASGWKRTDLEVVR